MWNLKARSQEESETKIEVHEESWNWESQQNQQLGEEFTRENEKKKMLVFKLTLWFVWGF